MEKNNKNQDHNFNIYNYRPWPVRLILPLLLTVFILAFMLNISIRRPIREFIISSINSNRLCPLSYDSLDLSFFFPGLAMKGVNISERCPMPIKNLKEMTFGFAGVKFMPFGILWDIELLTNAQKVHFSVITGPTKIHLLTKELVINTSLLQQLFPQMPEMMGSITSDGTLSTSYTGAENEVDINLVSNSLTIVQQKKNSILIPEIRLSPLDLKIKSENSSLANLDLKLGNSLSKSKDVLDQLFVEMKGHIRVKASTPSQSEINAKTQLEINKELLNEFAILNLVLGKYQEQQESNSSFELFKFSLSGPITLPKVLSY